MKRKVLSFSLVLISVLLLCGCSASFNSSKDNLEKKGYTVKVYDSELMTEMQNNMIYVYGGDGKILNALSATKDTENVVVIEFQKKSDLEIMYRELQSGISGSEKIDFSGNVLAYGTSDAVKIALK